MKKSKVFEQILNGLVLLGSLAIIIVASIELLDGNNVLSETFILKFHLWVCGLFLADFFVRWYTDGWTGYLATDNAGTNGVLLHALDFYERKGNQYDMVVLLQVTSPFRRAEDVIEAVKHYDDSIDMVTSVMPAKCNPYYDGFEDDADGLLAISKGDGSIERRQDAPRVWQQNGAVYVINPLQLKAKGLAGMTKIRKYVMDELHSVDIDNMLDWKIAEIMLKDKLVEI